MPATVIDPAVALVTLEEVRQWMKVEPGDTDAILNLLANSVSADCARYCGREFLNKTRTDQRYDGDGTPMLILPHRPVTAVTKLIAELGGAQLVEGPADDYVWYPNGVVRLITGYFPIGMKTVTVSYTAGYAQAAIPYDLKVAVLQAVEFAWNTQDKRRAGITSITTADGITTYTEAPYPKSVTAVWNRYRRAAIR